MWPLGRLVRSLNTRAFYGQALYDTDRYSEVRYYVYDELDRLVEMTTEGGKTFFWEYDNEGNVTKMTDPEGKITEYSYYRDNLLHKVTIKRGDPETVVGEFVYTYDAAGRLEEIQYPASTGITAIFRNDHLEYAITWFLLAAVWAVMTFALLWRIQRSKA